MISYFDKFFSVENDEEQPIQSFSETPAEPVKARDLTEAEDEVQQIHKQVEKDDDEYREEHTQDEDTEEDNSEDADEDMMDDGSNLSEETLLAMNEFDIRMTKIIPKRYLEYATPSGADTVGGCSGCSKGTEDAADVAIIDAEVTPVKKTVPNAPNNESSSGGGDDLGGGGMDDDMGGDDFSFYYHKYIDLSNDFAFAAQEGFITAAIGNLFKTAAATTNILLDSAAGITSFMLKDLLPVAFKIAKKTGAVLAHTYGFVRNVSSKLIVNKSLLTKVWNSKLKLYRKHVSVEKLQKEEVDGFEYNDFIAIAKSTIEIHDLMQANANKISDLKSSSPLFEKITSKFKAIGVVIDIVNDKIDLSELMGKHSTKTVTDHGFGPEHIEECMKYCKEISSRIPLKGQSPILAGLSGIANFMKKHDDTLVAEVKNKKIAPAKRKKDIDIYVSAELKIKFGADTTRAIYHIWNIMTTDMIKVCEKYEKALLPKVIDDD